MSESCSLKKRKYSYDDIHNLVRNGYFRFTVANDFIPDIILAIGGGGFIPARMLRTFMNIPILTTTVCFYDDEKNTCMEEPKIIQEVDKNLIIGKKVLIVDEVDDSRKTLTWLLNNLPKDGEYGIFVVHNKNKHKVANIPDNVPYIACQTTDDIWIEYPWDES